MTSPLTNTSCSSSSCSPLGVRQTLGLLMCLVLVLLPTSSLATASKRSLMRDGPPSRPNHFSSVDELNKYLTALTDYYTVLGRPRFGKRGGSFGADQLSAFNGNDGASERLGVDGSDPALSLSFVERLLSRNRQSRR